jgi:hypothetical protein
LTHEILLICSKLNRISGQAGGVVIGRDFTVTTRWGASHPYHKGGYLMGDRLHYKGEEREKVRFAEVGIPWMDKYRISIVLRFVPAHMVYILALLVWARPVYFDGHADHMFKYSTLTQAVGGEGAHKVLHPKRWRGSRQTPSMCD